MAFPSTRTSKGSLGALCVSAPLRLIVMRLTGVACRYYPLSSAQPVLLRKLPQQLPQQFVSDLRLVDARPQLA